MKVVFTQTGEVKEVSTGYARNYLFPKKVAVPATPAAVTAAAAQQAAHQTALAQTQAERSKINQQLTGATITIAAKANNTGGLFAAVTPELISKAIATEHGLMVEPATIVNQTIKQVGDYQITLSQSDASPIQFTLKVIAA